MKFKKAMITIQNIPQAKEQFQTLNGWLSECGRYGFCRSDNGKTWRAVDIPSGMLICSRKTRTECADYVERFKGKIVAAKGCEKYRNAVGNMVNYLKRTSS